VAVSLRAVLVLVGWAIIGFALAGLAKSTIVGIAVPLVFAFIVETVLIQVTGSETVALVLPSYSANQAVSVTLSTGDGYEHLAAFAACVALLGSEHPRRWPQGGVTGPHCHRG
jgi:hypothetical protein